VVRTGGESTEGTRCKEDNRHVGRQHCLNQQVAMCEWPSPQGYNGVAIMEGTLLEQTHHLLTPNQGKGKVGGGKAFTNRRQRPLVGLLGE
jgi:hypothetical protein